MNTRRDPGSDILRILADPISIRFVWCLDPQPGLFFSSAGRGATSYMYHYSIGVGWVTMGLVGKT